MQCKKLESDEGIFLFFVVDEYPVSGKKKKGERERERETL